MKNGVFYGFLAISTVVLMASGAFAYAQVPESDNSNNTTGGTDLPPASNTDNTTGGTDLPPVSNTDNTTGGTDLPPVSNTDNTTGGTDLPPVSNTDNTTGGTDLPPVSNTDNTTGGTDLPPTSNTDNTTSSGDNPAPVPSGGGGGGGGGGIGNGPIFILTPNVPSVPATPPAQIKLTCSTYLNEYLGVNVKNNPAEVLKLQHFLKTYEKLDVNVNGIFDQKTLEAVKTFQDRYAEDVLKKSWGINFSTGVVFITTKTKINDIVCNTQTDFTKMKLPRVITATSTLFIEPNTSPSPETMPETILESEVGLKPDINAEGNVAAAAKSIPSRFVDFLKSIWQTIVGGKDN